MSIISGASIITSLVSLRPDQPYLAVRLQPIYQFQTNPLPIGLDMRLIAFIALITIAAAQDKPCIFNGQACALDICNNIDDDCDPATDFTFTCCASFPGLIYCGSDRKVGYADCSLGLTGICSPQTGCS